MNTVTGMDKDNWRIIKTNECYSLEMNNIHEHYRFTQYELKKTTMEYII